MYYAWLRVCVTNWSVVLWTGRSAGAALFRNADTFKPAVSLFPLALTSCVLQAFGAPTIIATDANNKKQMIFGSDRMPILADILEEKYEGPLLELNKAKL